MTLMSRITEMSRRSLLWRNCSEAVVDNPRSLHCLSDCRGRVYHPCQAARANIVPIAEQWLAGEARDSSLAQPETARLLILPNAQQLKRARRLSTTTQLEQEIPTEFQEEETELMLRLRSDGATTSAAILGVDPDNSGAVAILQLDVAQSSAREMLSSCSVSVYDMPVQLVPTNKRFRRQADPCEVNQIVNSTLERLPAGGIAKAVVEKPVPGPLNGTFSVFGTGFSYGVWAGVLSSYKISIDTIAARTWKGGLGLNGLGKEGSRAMAHALFPQAAHLLRRKKDHGRAEALLLLAWAVGIRAKSVVSDTDNSIDSADVAEASGKDFDGMDEIERDVTLAIAPIDQKEESDIAVTA